jgi:hypothetical protein
VSVAFTREEGAETAAEVELPDRPISPHLNLVTASGLEALANAMADSRAAYNSAQQIEDASERRRAVAAAGVRKWKTAAAHGSPTRRPVAFPVLVARSRRWGSSSGQ